MLEHLVTDRWTGSETRRSSCCPVYAIKRQKEGTQLAADKFLQLLVDIKEMTPSHGQTLIISAPVSSGSVQEEFVVE